MAKQLLLQNFKEIFRSEPDNYFFAPGRVNLIGEHIDYNGGLVFPCAITKGTYAATKKRTDKEFRLFSVNFEELGVKTVNPADLTIKADDNWTAYVKGVLDVITKRGADIDFGLDVVVYGDLPNGSGLSSSASLEMLFCKIFNCYYNLNISPENMALIGKEVENNYIGVNSGIMDQFAIALGKQNSAILLNCDTQHYDYVPVNLKNYSLIIMNTNKRRELADSKYNERFAECQELLATFKDQFGINNLCELTSEQLETIDKTAISSTLFSRLRHVVTENERVIEATKALKEDNLNKFGLLLYASHDSLRDDYEVTGKELDTLVEGAKLFGSIGARMTGAGFGGCAIALVHNEIADNFIQEVGKYYLGKIGYAADFYKATVGSGPVKLK